MRPDAASPFPPVDPLEGMTGEDIAELLDIPATNTTNNDGATGNENLPEGWPEPMSEAAFCGLAGDFVRLVGPESEADPHALLLCFLVGFGAMVGRGPFKQVEATRHGVNQNVVLVGPTSVGRKGTANDRAFDILSRVDPSFFELNLMSGLSTGEGLIYQIRDDRWEDVEIKDSSPQRFERRIVDKGVTDKRRLVIQSEFAEVLHVATRPGNTLIDILRQAWDGTCLRKSARSNRDCCQKPHVSMIAHITPEEAQRLITSTEVCNGFGNRHLFCCSIRSKRLPHGGRPLDPDRLNTLVADIRSAIDAATRIEEVSFDEESYCAWEKEYYHVLTEGADGIFGAMTARAASHVLRLATLYARLAKSNKISLAHLKAATAVWAYCEESVRYVFGDSLGDETADAILRMLRTAPEGLTQTQINRGFGSHKSAAEIARALTLLQKRGKVTSEEIKTGGAPSTLWKIKETSA